MTLRTTAQTGVFSASSTWQGGIVPLPGDTVYRQHGHVLTFDVSIFLGDATAADDYAVAGPNDGDPDNGGCVVNSGVVLSLNGGIWCGNSPSYVTVNAGGTIRQTGDYAQEIHFGGWEQPTTLISNGTSGSWATIENTGSGSLSIYGEWGGGKWEGSYLHLNNIAQSTYSGNVGITNWVWDSNCGNVNCQDRSYTTSIEVEHCSFLNPSAEIWFRADDAVTLTKTFTNLVTYSQFNYTYLPEVTFEDCAFLGPLTGGSSTRKRFTRCVIYTETDTYPVGQYTDQFINCYFYNLGDNNPHFVTPGTLEADLLYDGCIAENLGGPWTTDFGDVFHGMYNWTSPHTWTTRYCIVLPNAAGGWSGCIIPLQPPNHTNVTVVCHNNIFGRGATAGENSDLHFGMVKDFCNNIIVPSTDSPMKLIWPIGSVVNGAVENADHNGGLGISDAYDYSTRPLVYQTAPGVNDLTSDPNFVDPSRDLASWAVTVLGSSGATEPDRWDDAFAALAAMNDPTSSDYDVNATPIGLVNWIKEGFVAQSSAYATGGIGGAYPTWIGAVEPTLGSWQNIAELNPPNGTDEADIAAILTTLKEDIASINGLDV